MRGRAHTQLRQRSGGRRPWQTLTLENRSFSSPLQDDILKLTRYCDALREENLQLSWLIWGFQNETEEEDACPYLGTRYDERLASLVSRIESRHSRVTALAKESSLLSPAISCKEEGHGKMRLLNENECLVRTALRLERDTVIERLRLKVFHDHREAQRLKAMLENVKNDRDIDEGVRRKGEGKDVIKHLKERIERERERIAALQSPTYVWDAAATNIQRIWRGYLARGGKGRRPKEVQEEVVETVFQEDGDEADDEDSDHVFDATEVRQATPNGSRVPDEGSDGVSDTPLGGEHETPGQEPSDAGKGESEHGNEPDLIHSDMCDAEDGKSGSSSHGSDKHQGESQHSDGEGSRSASDKDSRETNTPQDQSADPDAPAPAGATTDSDPDAH